MISAKRIVGRATVSQIASQTSGRSSMSLHNFETVLFEMPFSAMALTSSLTRRVETPLIQAS